MGYSNILAGTNKVKPYTVVYRPYHTDQGKRIYEEPISTIVHTRSKREAVNMVKGRDTMNRIKIVRVTGGEH